MELFEKDRSKIPVVIGITGHRLLDKKEIDGLYALVRDELKKIKQYCPNTPVYVMSSLAIGADQLCARAAMEEGMGHIAVLPMKSEEYEKDFEGEDKNAYRELLQKSAASFVADPSEDYQNGRDWLYRQAGIYVASHSMIMIALWDGREGKPEGCGTAETVGFALNNAYGGSEAGRLSTKDCPVIHIRASRESEKSLPGERIAVLGNRESFLEAVGRIDRFNKESAKAAAAARYGIENDDDEAVCGKMCEVYKAADKLSVQNASKYHLSLGVLAVLGSLIAVSFLLYDEAELYLLVPACGLMLALVLVISAVAKKSGAHTKYTEYRMLAEALRTGVYLRRSLASKGCASMLPWTSQMNIPWVKKTLNVLEIGESPHIRHNIRDEWIKGQMDYHAKAVKRLGKKQKTNTVVVAVATVITVIAYLTVLIFEFTAGGLAAPTVLADAQAALVRTVLKVVLGSLSAATLFTGNYYGKLSLDETAGNHMRMLELYRLADERIKVQGEEEGLLKNLAAEALNENAAWYAYHSGNVPEAPIV